MRHSTELSINYEFVRLVDTKYTGKGLEEILVKLYCVLTPKIMTSKFFLLGN